MLLPQIITDFRKLAEAADGMAVLTALVESAASDMGFPFIAMLHSRSLLRGSPLLIRHDNYPAGWDRRLIGRGQNVIDPILSIARRRVSGFLWSDVLKRSDLSRQQQTIVDAAYRVGMREGFTIPTNVPGEPEASISFASRSARPVGLERQLIMESIGRITFEAARRIMGFGVGQSLQRPLPPRVQECLYWIAQGKTDQDIADILGIGLETVRTYVKSAFRLFNVITRAQLVYRAVALGHIDFVPSIPSSG